MLTLGHFYFIKDQFFIDYPDRYLMKNKEVVAGVLHHRPCFFTFLDASTGLYWMIPISSQLSKFKPIAEKKAIKYGGTCDTIVFGDVLGYEKAFLIQNMFPIIDSYVDSEYKDSRALISVEVNKILEAELITKAKKVLALQRGGGKFIFPNVIEIEQDLLRKLP
jgi:hypothetical protein